MPKALVTGGTGFVGGHVVHALLNDGWSVRVLARDPSKKGSLIDGSGADLVRGDLSSDDGLEEAARGVDAVVHAAGILKARSLEDYREVNRRGTERLLRAAARSSPRARFVLVSSQAAAGPARRGRPVTEPNSAPTSRRWSPSALPSSVGNGPAPTRVVQALVMPITVLIRFGPMPAPTEAPPATAELDVTNGYVP